MNSSPIIAVICEFNPFHNGHDSLFREIKSEHPNSTILCLMSGNYVQRGEPAIADKYLRAKIAVLNGADLVLELPLPFSVQDARGFAKGAIKLLKNLGGVDYLYFGSESGSTEQLVATAKKLSTEEFQQELKLTISEHPQWVYPVIVSTTYERVYAEACPFFSRSNPNDVLALEYVKELLGTKSTISPRAVKRIGGEHNDQVPSKSYASATAIRSMLVGNEARPLPCYLPEKAFRELSSAIENGNAPIQYKQYQRIALSKIRELIIHGEDLKDYLYCKQLSEKLYKTISKAKNLEQLYDLLKSKNFTMARIKRALLCCYLEIPQFAADWNPEYSTVLATSVSGCQYLSKIRKTKRIPVITKPAQLKALSKNSSQIELNINADKRFAMFFSDAKDESFVFAQSPFHREE